MNQAATPTEPARFLHRDLSTTNQVAVLLSIGQMMMQYLSREPEEAENIPGQRPLPGESRLAAEATLIKTLARLDEIVDNSKRWGLDYQLALEKLFIENTQQAQVVAEEQIKMMKAQTEREKAQRAAALEVQSPHFIYRPSLARQEDGTWAAILGDPADEFQRVFGLGATPAAAARAFDIAFSGALPEQQERAIKIQNEINSMVPRGIETVEEASPDGEADAGDSGGA